MARNQFSKVVSHMYLAAVLALGYGAAVRAQTPAAPGHHDAVAESAQAGMHETMIQRHATMMAGRKEMMASMAAADQKLSELVARMNTAKGDDQIAAIAAVVTELVAQRVQMQQQMMAMQNAMMSQMMAHMSAMHGTDGMMNKAPAPQAGDPGAAEHREHHQEK